jgi:crotonobetainyl-CoA:carnitine CoA-transferase CaiB-like acyl-CoA transferase
MGERGPKVLDVSHGIPGAYAALLLHHAGGSVARAEGPDGDPLRRWRLAPGEPDGDGALYRYLRQGQTAVRMDGVPEDASGADVLLASPDAGSAERLRAIAAVRRELTVVAITPFGLAGPLAHRRASDLTVQAESGALAIRGRPDEPPVQMGGRTVDWLAGAYAGVAAYVGWRGARDHGRGLFVDLALCDVGNLGGCNFMDLMHAIGHGVDGAPEGPMRGWESPSVEPSADGWVGFNTNSPHHFEAFLRMLERPDLIESGEFTMATTRTQRRAEWTEVIHSWTRRHTTDEIIERAVAEGVPVAPVSNGRTVLELDHAAARGAWIDSPEGDFRMPSRPWRIDGDRGPRAQPAPAARPVEHVPWDTAPRPSAPSAEVAPELPLAGLRILDLTAWWAGPAATGVFAALGADVIHVEAPARMDHMRLVGALFFDRPDWWELSSFFLAVNVNKRDLVLDLASDEGRRLALDLIAHCDVVLENFTPRVLEKLGLDWKAIHAANPRTVLVRMPAYGLDGPWRDRPGFAQTMEQAVGLAWITGRPDDQPRIQRGPCDPNGGVHAAFAALVALEERERTGEGMLVEVAMFDTAIGIAAEPAIEWSAYGHLVERDGNRAPWVAPQGVYATAEPDGWIAVSATTDEGWRALAGLIGRPDLAADPDLATLDGRRARHDELDAAIGVWAAHREPGAAVEALVAAGVPAAVANDPRLMGSHPHLRARGYFELIDHPVAGVLPTPVLPFRVDGTERWGRSPAPRFGQHNHEILGGLLGVGDDELTRLEEAGVIASRPLGF